MFIKSCKMAYELATPAQKLLVLPCAISQLEGSALSFSMSKDFENLESFLREINEHFSNTRNFNEILSELHQTKQRESMASYIEKIKSLRDELLATDVITNDASGQIKDNYDNLILSHFMIGLQSKYHHRMILKNPPNCESAFKYALEDERTLNFYDKAHTNLFAKPRENQNPSNKNYNNNFKPKFSSNNQSNQERFCTYCKMKGHTMEYCSKRDSNKKSPKPSTSNNNYNNRQINNLNASEEMAQEQSISEITDVTNLLETL